MYTLETAYSRVDRRAGRWVEVDLSNEPITTVISDYGDVFLLITYPTIAPEQKALRLDHVRSLINNVSASTTVTQWLTNFGNQSLPFETTLPTFEEGLVHYFKAWHHDYKIDPLKRNGLVGAPGSKTEGEDLLIHRDGTDHSYLDANALFSVNGFFHRHTLESDGVRILDGNKTLRQSNDNQVGIHSFEQVGEVQCYPITDDEIIPLNIDGDDKPLKNALYVKLPDGVDIDNKTVLISIGGFLHTYGNAFYPIGERVFKIELNQLHFDERYFHSRRFMNLSSLPLTEYDHNDSLLSRSELYSDPVIKAYLKLSQTFFVVVDTPYIFHEMVPLESAHLPGRWLRKTADQWPMVGAFGRGLEYHILTEDHFYVYHGQENRRDQFIFKTGSVNDFTALDDSREPSQPFVHDTAFLRRIGKQVI